MSTGDGESVFPIGELFTRVYGSPQQPTKDSPLFRKRVGAYVQHDLFKEHWELQVFLKKESGLAPRFQSSAPGILYYYWEEYFTEMPRDNFLNALTLVWRFLWVKHKVPRRTVQGKSIEFSVNANSWRAFIDRALKEENLGFTTDEMCGIHHAVDEQFALQRNSVLQCLDNKRYSAVAAAFEDSHRYFSSTPSDTKAAIRSIFESVEILAKLMVSTDRLTAKLVSNELKQRFLLTCSSDAIATRAIGRTIEGFADWVDGLHHYRHGQVEETPIAPPEDFTIYAISSGSAFLRWLVSIDNALRSELPAK